MVCMMSRTWWTVMRPCSNVGEPNKKQSPGHAEQLVLLCRPSRYRQIFSCNGEYGCVEIKWKVTIERSWRNSIPSFICLDVISFSNRASKLKRNVHWSKRWWQRNITLSQVPLVRCHDYINFARTYSFLHYFWVHHIIVTGAIFV